MTNHAEEIWEIAFTLDADGEQERLTIPVPYDYDGAAVLRLVLQDLADPDADVRLSEGTAALRGEMDADALAEWRQRARELEQVDSIAMLLDDAGLTPGVWPGPLDERTGEPSALALDETVEHDLANAAVAEGRTKAAFRAAREASGASQAALAEALGVNARTVKRWETPGQPEPPRDAWSLVEAWRADAASGARWHVRQAEELRDDFHEAYVLTLYRSQDELDADLAPLLAQAPSYRWQDALEEARERDVAGGGEGSHLEVERPYTNCPGTRSYWRANAAARLAAAIMDERGIAYGFAYPGELDGGWGGRSVWVPRADVQRIEGPGGVVIVCGMR